MPSTLHAQAQTQEEEGPDSPEPGYSSLGVKPPAGAGELQRALQRLAQDSRDVDALIDAGNAALLLGDPQAAVGFFARAEEVEPANGRVKAGLGSALLLAENPLDALRLYDEALRLGLPESAIAADRGLAFDLVGNNRAAQADYQLALRRGGDDETMRRYALSLAIAGDRAAAEAQLDPLIRRRDPAAWRMRAFALAINGDVVGAQTIAEATLPANMAQGLKPYLAMLPRLTAAQQAAAAHFGHFPSEARVGKDDPSIRQLASAGSASPRADGADAGMIPSGEPLGAKTGEARPRNERQPRRRPGRERRTEVAARTDAPPPVRTPPPTPAEAPTAVATSAASLPPPVYGPQAEQDAPASRAAPPRVAEQSSTLGVIPPQPTTQPPVTLAVEVPVGPDIRGYSPGASPRGQGAAVSPPPEPAPPRPRLADAMAGLTIPASERAPDEDAVDLSRIQPAKPKIKPAPPPPPKHPSRAWVQVAGGANRTTLPREWKRLVDASPDLFRGKQGWWTPVNRSNRLLTGPFANARDAQAFVNQLSRAGLSGFVFESAEGQEVTRLGK